MVATGLDVCRGRGYSELKSIKHAHMDEYSWATRGGVGWKACHHDAKSMKLRFMNVKAGHLQSCVLHTSGTPRIHSRHLQLRSGDLLSRIKFCHQRQESQVNQKRTQLLGGSFKTTSLPTQTTTTSLCAVFAAFWPPKKQTLKADTRTTEKATPAMLSTR